MAWLKNIFTKNTPPYTPVLGYATELHNHLVPGIDDGVKTLEETLQIINTMHAMGVKKIITTPHIMSDFYKNTPENIAKGVEVINKALAEHKIDVTLTAGAEYYADEYFLEKVINQAPLLTFGNSYLLFETSFMNEASYFSQMVFALKSRNIKPILAHPERYRYTYKNFEILEKMYETGVYFQLNLLSLAGYYGKEAELTAQKLIQLKMVDFVGTDTHSALQLSNAAKALVNPYYRKLLESGQLKNHLL